MRRKWNKPLVRPDVLHAQVDGDQLVEGVAYVLCDDDVEMIRQGYKCVECLELLAEAFPETCFLCGYRVKELQSEAFARVFKGWTHTGSNIDWDAEQERLEKQRFDRELAEGLRTKGVVLPRGV